MGIIHDKSQVEKRSLWMDLWQPDPHQPHLVERGNMKNPEGKTWHNVAHQRILRPAFP
jgi:hypothetical protein